MTFFSFCSPSLGPTSTMRTREGNGEAAGAEVDSRAVDMRLPPPCWTWFLDHHSREGEHEKEALLGAALARGSSTRRGHIWNAMVGGRIST